MSKFKILVLLAILFAVGLAILFTPAAANGKDGDMPVVLALKERAAVMNRWLKIRMEKVLPQIMRRENIDMWVVICQEHNEEPVYSTLVPKPNMFAWRLSMLIFNDLGETGVERISINPFGSGKFRSEMNDFYTLAQVPDIADPWEKLAGIIRDRNPQRIGINESDTFAFADGLTASLKRKLVQALGPELSSRLVSAERLAVGWLEKRIPEEIETYSQINAITHAIIAEFFSRKVITPGVTTLDDLTWWTREKFAELKLGTWFQPIFYVLRPQNSVLKDSQVIHFGDLLRCDVGVTYLGLNSDIQESAYVLRPNEEDVPQGLKEAFKKGNRLQDILTSEFIEKRTGNEVLAAAVQKAKAEGLKPLIYSHPLGYHGHAAGPRIGFSDMQGGVPGIGDYPLFYDTVYAIELNVRATIPEWGKQEVTIALEEDAVFTSHGIYYLDGRQTKFHLIK